MKRLADPAPVRLTKQQAKLYWSVYVAVVASLRTTADANTADFEAHKSACLACDRGNVPLS